MTSVPRSLGLDAARTLTFRCPPELLGVIPAPVPAAQGLPGWLKTMPASAFSGMVGGQDDTLKRCPPFLDAMTQGFLIPLICDVHVKDGEFTWDADLPQARSVDFPRSPIGVHDPGQAEGAPFAQPDRFLVKFHNLWTLQAPEGYGVLFTHPLNRPDLPFTTLTGMVDCDRYHDAWIHFPAVWRDEGFEGVLPRGTPIAQCVPVRREAWRAETAAFSPAEAEAAHALTHAIAREKGVYRKRFRA